MPARASARLRVGPHPPGRTPVGDDESAIREWILLDGYRNTVMVEYLAHIAATTGDPAGRLAAPDPAPALLSAAGEIIVAHLNGGPASDITDYEDGALAVDRYTHHLETQADNLADAVAVLASRSS